MEFQNVFSWVQKASPIELGAVVVLILLTVLLSLGIVYMTTLIFSKIVSIIFQVSLILFIFYFVSIVIFNDENSKIIGKTINEQVGKISEDVGNWYDNIQIYGWISENIGLSRFWGYASHFGFNVGQSIVYDTYEGIKETLYNMTNFWQ